MQAILSIPTWPFESPGPIPGYLRKSSHRLCSVVRRRYNRNRHNFDKGHMPWEVPTGVDTNCDDSKSLKSINLLTTFLKNCAPPNLPPQATIPTGNNRSRFTASSAPSAPESSTSKHDICSRYTTKTGITTTIPRTGRTGKICACTATMMNTAGGSLVIMCKKQKRTSRRKSVYNPLDGTGILNLGVNVLTGRSPIVC